MGLPASNTLHHVNLIPEAVVIELKDQSPWITSINQTLAILVAHYLIMCLRDGGLDRFFHRLTAKLRRTDICGLCELQLQVIIIQCLRDWLQELECAISDWQHSDGVQILRPGQKTPIFRITIGPKSYRLQLLDISCLRTFLYGKLDVPILENRLRPVYQGIANLSRHYK